MPRFRVYHTEGVVLRRVDFGEADRIIIVFTPGRGKLETIARGVRRLTSRRAGHLEPLTRTRLLLAQGRQLDVVTQAEALDLFPNVRSDLERTAAGFYLAELVDRFTEPQQPNVNLYRHLVTGLTLLDQGHQADLVRRYFEMRLLDVVGFRPELYRCVECSRDLRPVTNYFSPAAGGVLCLDCGGRNRTVTVGALKVLRFIQSAPTYEQIARLRVPAGIMRELELLLRDYLRFLLERDLKSTAFLDGLRALPTRS
jgi:DNA repair protein RecO (recombination protein O)